MLVEHEFKSRNVTVTTDLPEGLPKVNVDKARTSQVLINVIINALHAMDKSGGDTLHVRAFHANVEGLERNEGVRTSDHLRLGDSVVTIEIDDSGCGLPDQEENVFDPFFTTKPTGEGTGLGLTVARKIIDLHKGRITLSNREEGGVRTTIELKTADANP